MNRKEREAQGRKNGLEKKERNICIRLHPFKILKPTRFKVNMKLKLTPHTVYFLNSQFQVVLL